MANTFGYNQLFSMEPEIWFIDGYVHLGADGYTPSLFATDGYTLPKGIKSLKHNGTGDFTLLLADCWNKLLFASIVPVVPDGDSPLNVSVQVESFNVGYPGTLDGQQGVTFHVATVDGSSTSTDMGAHSGFLVSLILKRSSA